MTRETGLADAMATLHRSPGEHAPAIRMNWFFMQAWRWLADTTRLWEDSGPNFGSQVWTRKNTLMAKTRTNGQLNSPRYR